MGDFNLFVVEKENKEDLLKTESMDSDNSSNSECSGQSANCNLELNNFGNLSNLANPNNNFASFLPNAAGNIPSQSKRRRSLHSTFLLLKKKLNLEQFMRKTQIDSLLKKCKSKAFKTIHEALKKCLNIKLPRLPQHFITNIKIDFNKVCLEKTILDIYREHKIIPSVEDFVNKKYLIEDKLQVFKDFLSLTFRNVFEYYINSKQYVKDYYHIQQREGEKFAILFNYISKVFIQYYTKSKGNKPKNCNKIEEEEERMEEIMNDSAGKVVEINGITNNNTNMNTTMIPDKSKSRNNKPFSNPQPIKRKPVFKRIKVKRVSLKKKIIKVCEVVSNNNACTPIFQIKKNMKKKQTSNKKLNFINH